MDERSKAGEIEQAERVLAAAEQKSGKDNVDVCPALDDLAALYHRDGLYAKAELLYKRSAELLAKSGDVEKLAFAQSRLGMLYRTEGKLDDAEAIYLRALGTAEQSGVNARLRAERLCCLAAVYFDKQQWQQCKGLLEKATAAYQAEFGQHSCYSRLCCMALAAVAKREGKNAEADELFERSRTDISAADADTGGDDRAVLELIQGFYAQGRMSEVEMLLAQTIFCDEQHLWPHHPRVATALQLRGDLFRAQGRFADAERSYKLALEIRMQELGPAHPEVAETAMSMATMYMSQNRFADAEPTLKIALKTRVRAFGVENPGVAACVETYAALLKRTKRGAIAMKLEARARDIRTRLVWQADKASAANNLPLV